MSSFQACDWKNVNCFLLNTYEIPSFLGPNELCVLSCVSKKHRDVCSQEKYWRIPDVELRLENIFQNSVDKPILDLTGNIKRQYIKYSGLKYRTVKEFNYGYSEGIEYMKHHPRINETASAIFSVNTSILCTTAYFTYNWDFDQKNININPSEVICTTFALFGAGNLFLWTAAIKAIPCGKGILKSSRIAFPMLIKLASKRMLENKVLTLTDISVGTTLIACAGISTCPAIALSTIAVGVAKIADESIAKKGSQTLLGIICKLSKLIPSIFQQCRRR